MEPHPVEETPFAEASIRHVKSRSSHRRSFIQGGTRRGVYVEEVSCCMMVRSIFWEYAD